MLVNIFCYLLRTKDSTELDAVVENPVLLSEEYPEMEVETRTRLYHAIVRAKRKNYFKDEQGNFDKAEYMETCIRMAPYRDVVEIKPTNKFTYVLEFTEDARDILETFEDAERVALSLARTLRKAQRAAAQGTSAASDAGAGKRS